MAQWPELATIMVQPSPGRKTSRAAGIAALILSSMFRFAAALTLAAASALAAALAPAAIAPAAIAPAAIAPAAIAPAAFGGLRG